MSDVQDDGALLTFGLEEDFLKSVYLTPLLLTLLLSFTFPLHSSSSHISFDHRQKEDYFIMTSRSQSSSSTNTTSSTSTSYYDGNTYGFVSRLPVETELTRTCNKIDEEMIMKQVLTRPETTDGQSKCPDVNVGLTMINRFIGENMTDLKAAINEPKEYFGSVRETISSRGTETDEMRDLMSMLTKECEKTNQEIARLNEEYEIERNKQFMSKAIH